MRLATLSKYNGAYEICVYCSLGRKKQNCEIFCPDALLLYSILGICTTILQECRFNRMSHGSSWTAHLKVLSLICKCMLQISV